MLLTSCFREFIPAAKKYFFKQFPKNSGIKLIPVFLLLFAAFQTSYANNNENKLHAVYMYNFLKFVHWPEKNLDSTVNTIEVCIIGKDPFGSLLDTWKTKKINNKNIHLNYLSSSKMTNKCHMAFIGEMNRASYIRALNNLEGKGILTVSANNKFAQLGGMIGFIMHRNRVRFNINRTQAQHNGLEIDSKLLELAISIY